MGNKAKEDLLIKELGKALGCYDVNSPKEIADKLNELLQAEDEYSGEKIDSTQISRWKRGKMSMTSKTLLLLIKELNKK